MTKKMDFAIERKTIGIENKPTKERSKVFILFCYFLLLRCVFQGQADFFF